jgi:hypothetical protein
MSAPNLNANRLINVTVNLTPTPVAGRTFNILMICGDSNVINGTQRFRTYNSAGDVASDFGTTAPETTAANLYFGQKPQPTTCMVGRWLRTAQAALNVGGVLAPSAQLLANWTAITSGGFSVNIDGSVQALTALNFSSATNLNGVATIITAALSGGATCTFDGQNFQIVSGTTGVGTQASGTVTLTANPAANDTLTLNATVITFVSGTPSGSQVQIGASNLVTLASLLAFLNASTDTQLVKCTYSTLGNVLTITYKLTGVGGNSFTLAKSSTAITLSAGDLAGGVVTSSVGYATSPASGTDISAMLGLNAANSTGLIPGFAAETALQCVAALANASSAWYGIMFNASVQPSDNDNLAIAAFIEAQTTTRAFGVTTQETNAINPNSTTDLAYLLNENDYEQTCSQYSTQNIAAIASFFGRAFSVDFTQQNSTITLMYKQEPGVIAENIDNNAANALQEKNCNVYANYSIDPSNPTAIIQYGTMASGDFFDEVQGADWFQNAIQTSEFNTLFTTGKVPQTDAGSNQLVTAAAAVCQQAVFNGFAAPGQWNGPSFGSLTTGQYLKLGYYIYIQPVSQQSQADRQARKAPPMQIALKLAGANQTVDMLVNINP